MELFLQGLAAGLFDHFEVKAARPTLVDATIDVHGLSEAVASVAILSWLRQLRQAIDAARAVKDAPLPCNRCTRGRADIITGWGGNAKGRVSKVRGSAAAGFKV